MTTSVFWEVWTGQHKGLLLQYKNDSSQLEFQLGAAYNSASSVAQIYNIGGNYKMLQFLRFRKGFKHLELRFLALHIGQENPNSGLVLELTTGGLVDLKLGKFKARLEGYYQTGNWAAANSKQAFLLATKFTYTAAPLRFEVGGDWLSGTSENQQTMVDNSFNPWLGTNHIFYGHLDYFYVGNSHGGVGLIDAYANVFWTVNKAFKMGVMYHYFQAPNAFADQRTGKVLATAFLGHEVDLIAHYQPKKYLKLSFGYAQLFGASPLETLKRKPAGAAGNLNNWAWVMLNIDLELFRHQRVKEQLILLENQRF